ncbi:hypothetical protein F4679DRAFT_412677 [Xylaria curta]|nr:hypothetical protein F4679DRAFT_412677 [Xylaria curta]
MAAMKCPSCGHAVSRPLGLHSDGMTTTHDTSSTSYHTTLPEWLGQLDQAIKSAFKTRFARYSEVAVLMICWEETYHGAMKDELCRLASVFRTVYKYRVKIWQIPSEDPDLAIDKMIREFLDYYGHPNNLLIVYYAGHAIHNSSGGYFPIWQPSSNPEGGREVDTAIFHPLLVRARNESPDVLLLYDSCFALSSHRSNTNTSRAEVEGLFAGGFESQVPIPGEDSFTKHLTDALTAAQQDKPLTIVELHRRIIVRLQSFHKQGVFDRNNEIRTCPSTGKALCTRNVRVTPSHLFLAGNEKPRLIALMPLVIPSELIPVDSSSLTLNENQSSWPKVLLAIRLADDKSIEEDLKKWLLDAPPGIVEYRGIFPSFSSLLLMEVSVAIWNLLPPCPAVSFISFTTNHSISLEPRPKSPRGNTVPASASNYFNLPNMFQPKPAGHGHTYQSYQQAPYPQAYPYSQAYPYPQGYPYPPVYPYPQGYPYSQAQPFSQEMPSFLYNSSDQRQALILSQERGDASKQTDTSSKQGKGSRRSERTHL